MINVEEFYDNLGAAGMSSHMSEERHNQYIEFLIGRLKKNDIILDAACGYGRITNALSQLGFNVSGIDISSVLIEKAIEENQKIDYSIGDIRKLPYADSSFSSVLCLWSSFNHMLNIEDQVIVLNEFSRVLQAKGKAIIDVPLFNDVNEGGSRIEHSIINGEDFEIFRHDKKSFKLAIDSSDFDNLITDKVLIGNDRLIFTCRKSA